VEKGYRGREKFGEGENPDKVEKNTARAGKGPY